jgi:lipopolysaccharide transport system ATP-binding protein
VAFGTFARRSVGLLTLFSIANVQIGADRLGNSIVLAGNFSKSMSDTVIRCENLGKKFIIGQQQEQSSRHKTLRDVITGGVKSFNKRFLKHTDGKVSNTTKEDFWALKDVSFEIKQGDRVGIIGRNGAGKSTLLKILSRITEPTKGRISIRGRVASLLEVGTGFHQELTGRENIYLNGAILGMSKVEINRKFDEIVAFAEVEKFLDTPVKRYSSGMYVRLAFAVAAHLEPEILIVDEVLAVGDKQFQSKCLGKMEEVGKEGRTVLYVSHSMPTVTQLCTKGIYLRGGQLVQVADVNSIVSKYLTENIERSGQKQLVKNEIEMRTLKQLFFKKITITDQEGVISSELDARYPFHILIDYEVTTPVKNVELSVRIETDEGRTVFMTHQSDCFPKSSSFRSVGEYQVSIKLPGMFLMPGTYMVSVMAHEPGVKYYDIHEYVLLFSLTETGTRALIYHQHHYPHRGLIMVEFPWQEKELSISYGD